LIGQTVSHFKITDGIGSGGMGDVYLADDLKLPRRVALKFLSSRMASDKRAVERFLREAHATSALDHPNICTVYETGETSDGEMFIAMAYYEGGSVQTLLEDGPPAIEDTVSLVVGVADGLHRAHQKGILHRDIKPANLMITKEGIVKVVDFGIAKLSKLTGVTGTGISVGTLAYMSPEQTRGQKIDDRSDIFSVGVTLYEMLTGELPFWADNELALGYAICNKDPKPMRSIRRDIPESLERVVSKALAKDPGDRYSIMVEMRDDLLDVLREIAPTRATSIEALIRPVRKHVERNLRYIGWGALVVVVGTAIVLNWQRIQCALGLCGLGDTKGVAVMAFETDTNDRETRTFAAGLVTDLANRVKTLAEFDDDLWIVPPSRIGNVNNPGDAKSALGVDAVLTGSIDKKDGDYRLQLSLVDAETGIPIENLKLAAGASWRNGLTVYLADLLEVDVDPERLAAGNCTGEAQAFNSYILGLGYLESKDDGGFDSAIAAFDRAIAIDSSCTDVHVRRAEALFEKAKALQEDSPWKDDAIAACEDVLSKDDSNAAAHLLLGLIKSSRNQKEEALKNFARAAELKTRDSYVLNRLAWTQVELGRYDEAEKIDRSAIEANPQYFGPYMDLGYLYYVLGRYDEAIEQFETIRGMAPNYAATYNYLGALLYIKEDWEGATAAFEKSFELGRTYDACANLGTLYYMYGRFEDAARMYEWAREYKHGSYLVVGNLAAAYYLIEGERERADSLFELAIELAEKKRKTDPDNATLVAFLAGYYSINHPDKAVVLAEQSLKMDPENSEVAYRIAQVYEQIGERAKALVLLGRALDLGYSRKELEHEQLFEDLRQDPRYELLVAERGLTD